MWVARLVKIFSYSDKYEPGVTRHRKVGWGREMCECERECVCVLSGSFIGAGTLNLNLGIGIFGQLENLICYLVGSVRLVSFLSGRLG